jgi:hypothetical protein
VKKYSNKFYVKEEDSEWFNCCRQRRKEETNSTCNIMRSFSKNLDSIDAPYDAENCVGVVGHLRKPKREVFPHK